MDVNDKVHESARESFCDEKGCQSGMYFEYEPFSTVYASTATVATVHKPRDSSELSHGHIAVTGSPACSVRKFDPKLPKRPKLSARNVVRLTATNCALLPRLQPADHLRPFLPFKRHELQTISNHSTLSGGNLWVRGSRQSAVRDIQAANSKKRHKSVEKIQISVINNDTHNKNKYIYIYT